MEPMTRAALILIPLVVLLCATTEASMSWEQTDPHSGTLSLDGEVLLEVSPPTAEQAAIYGQASPWTAEGGVVEYRRAIRDDVFVMHGAPVGGPDIAVAADVTITDGDVAGIALRAGAEGGPCYLVLLGANSNLVRVAPIPWPGKDMIAVPHDVEHGRTYRVEASCEETDVGTRVRVLVDGELIAEHLDTEYRPKGTRVGTSAHTSLATVADITAWTIQDGEKGEVLLAGGAFAPEGGATQGAPERLRVTYADGVLEFTGKLPETGEGIGALTRIVHAVRGAKELHLPHLAPTPGYIIADHSYRSPALAIANDDVALALAPDIDDVRTGHLTGWKSWMDYDHPQGAVTIAAGNYRLGDVHVLYNALPVEYRGQNVRVRVHVLASKRAEDRANPYGLAARFIWDRWGRPMHKAGGAQRAPLSTNMEHIVRWAFTPEGWEDVWQSFEIDGRECGAPAFIIDIAQHPSVPVEQRRWREQQSIWNQAWFSTQRCANGLLRYARIVGSEDLERRARLMTNIALSAPQTDGLFPAIYTAGGGGYKLYKDAAGWDEARWTNSDRRPPGTSGDACHILDAAFTARLLLEWSDLVGGDDEAAGYATRFADRLVKLQLPSGAFPGWVEPDGTVPGMLAEGPETAMGVALLLELPENPEWRDAAMRGLQYLENGPVADGRWEDYETYFSCCRYWGDRVGEPIARNGIYKRNTLSMFWCAEAFLAGYRVTGDEHYLAVGRRCLDELSLYQQVWDPPFIPAPCHGGFGVMNADGEWNDARQSLFAPIYLDYYAETGNAEYFERGVAAIRSSFAMLYCPENAQVRQEYERRYEFFGEESYGFMMENISHGGPDTEPIGSFTIPTWGNLSALSGAVTCFDRHRKSMRKHKISLTKFRSQGR